MDKYSYRMGEGGWKVETNWCVAEGREGAPASDTNASEGSI